MIVTRCISWILLWVINILLFTLLFLFYLICRYETICRLTQIASHKLMIETQFTTHSFIESQLPNHRLLVSQLTTSTLFSFTTHRLPIDRLDSFFYWFFCEPTGSNESFISSLKGPYFMLFHVVHFHTAFSCVCHANFFVTYATYSMWTTSIFILT